MWGFYALSELLCFPSGSAVKILPAVQETRVQSMGQEDPLEKGMATRSSILAWKIPWTEGPGWLQSIGLHRVGHDQSDLAHTAQHSELLKGVRGWGCEGACLQGWTASREDTLRSSVSRSPSASDSQHLTKHEINSEGRKVRRRWLFKDPTAKILELIVLVWYCCVARVQPLSRVFSHPQSKGSALEEENA